MPSPIHPTTIRFPVILAYYFINAVVWISDFKPLHLEGDVDVHKYYLELYNLENLQPKLHYLHFQFLRICKKHDTRIFPSRAEWPELTLECESSKSMFPTFDPHQLLARLSILGKQQQCCYSVPKSWANIFPEKWHRTPQQHQGIKAEWKDRKRTRYHTSLNKTRST